MFSELRPCYTLAHLLEKASSDDLDGKALLRSGAHLFEVGSYHHEKTKFSQIRHHTRNLTSRIFCNRYSVFFKDKETGKTRAYCRVCTTALFGRVVDYTLYGLLDDAPLISAMQCLVCFNIDSYRTCLMPLNTYEILNFTNF